MKGASDKLKEPDNQARAARLSSLSRGFILSAGSILALTGTCDVLRLFDKSQSMSLQDPLFGMPFCYVLPLLGLIELSVAWLCLSNNKTTLSLWSLAGLASVFLSYRIALWTMGWRHPWAFISGLSDLLNLSPIIADGIVFAVVLYFLIGICATVWLEQLAQTTPFQKIFCHSCGGRLKFAIENRGQTINCPRCDAKITLRKPDEMLKMSCFFCKEHIEFPAHALGRKVMCPHCNMEIGLRETV